MALRVFGHLIEADNSARARLRFSPQPLKSMRSVT